MVGLHATRGLQLHDEERVRKHYRIRQSRYRDVASSGCVVREVELTEITGVCLLERRSDSHAVPEVDPNPSLAALLLAPVVKPLLLIGRENTWHTQCPRCHGESLLRGLLDDLLEGTTDLGLLALPPVREELGLPDDDVGIEVTHIGVNTPVATARERNLRCLRYAKDHKIRDETLEACPRCCIVTAVREKADKQRLAVRKLARHRYLARLAALQAGVVDTGWVTPDQFLAGYGAAQAVPGPLFTFAAYLGTLSTVGPGGVAGAAIALTGVFLPGFLLLTGVLPFWNAFRSRPWAQALMRGANAAVVGILAAALYDPVFTTAITGAAPFLLALICFVLLITWRAPAWAVVIVGAAGGILITLIG